MYCPKIEAVYHRADMAYKVTHYISGVVSSNSCIYNMGKCTHTLAHLEGDDLRDAVQSKLRAVTKRPIAKIMMKVMVEVMCWLSGDDQLTWECRNSGIRT